MFLSRKKLIITAVIWLATVLGPSAYFYQQYQHEKYLLDNPTAAAKEEIKSLVDKVGRYVELPRGEEPSIATITDLSKLAGQPFFAKAQLGDKVLIFTKAKMAILYRPSTDKIIEIAPVGAG